MYLPGIWLPGDRVSTSFSRTMPSERSFSKSCTFNPVSRRHWLIQAVKVNLRTQAAGLPQRQAIGLVVNLHGSDLKFRAFAEFQLVGLPFPSKTPFCVADTARNCAWSRENAERLFIPAAGSGRVCGKITVIHVGLGFILRTAILEVHGDIGWAGV